MDIGAEVEGGDEGGDEAGDEAGGDSANGFFTTVAYLRISFDKDDFIIGFRFNIGIRFVVGV